MSQELLYTSAPRGLKPGSRGFCTVLSTQGMAAPLTTALEGLSGYRPVYPTGDDHADRNPVVYSHLKLQSSGRAVNVLSRIADFGLDYSQRANKLAHHVVLDRTELLPGGPANLLSMRDFMRDEWSGEPTVIALKPVKRETDPPSGVCRAWQELTGDAGWAGVLAESFLQAPDRLVVLLFAPGQDILPLFNEAISLLPVERRWDVTFSTYFTGLATGTTCTWRAVVQDSKDAHESLRFVNALRLDLTSQSLGRATGGPLVDSARSGSRPHNMHARATSRTGPSDVVFAEAEQVHVEFSSDDRTPASFRRTVASPQPSKQPQAQFAPPPQQSPPDRETTYKMLPATTSSASQSRPPRSLADVIEAESQRPGFGVGTWLGLGALALSVAALLSVIYMDRGHKDDGQHNLTKNQSGQQSADSKKSTAGKGDDSSNKPSTIPAHNPKPAHQADAANDTASKDTAKSPTGADATASVSKPDGAAKPPISATLPTGESSPPPTPPKPDIPTPAKPKIVVEYLVLPDKDKFVELYSFKRVPSSPAVPPAAVPQPGMLLLKPDWLPYVDYKASASHEKTYKAKRSIVEKNDAGGEPSAVAVFTEYEEAVPEVKYRLKSLLESDVPWLGWYRIRILSATLGSPPIKDVAFSPFPIGEDGATVGRRFKKNPLEQFKLQWALPMSAIVESKVKNQSKPKLVLDRLILKIDDQTISLAREDRKPQSAWTCSLDKFTSQVAETFHGSTSQTSKKPELIMELSSGKEGPEIVLQLSRAQSFLDGIESDLDQSLTLAKSDITGAFKTIYNKPKGVNEKAGTGDDSKQVDEIKELLKTCTAEKPIGAKKIRESLQKAIDDAKGQLKADDLKNVEKKLGKALSLYESVEKFPPLEKSLNNVTVISAHLYYTLTGTTKNAAGETITLTEDVDVVNFDDSK